MMLNNRYLLSKFKSFKVEILFNLVILSSRLKWQKQQPQTSSGYKHHLSLKQLKQQLKVTGAHKKNYLISEILEIQYFCFGQPKF